MKKGMCVCVCAYCDQHGSWKQIAFFVSNTACRDLPYRYPREGETDADVSLRLAKRVPGRTKVDFLFPIVLDSNSHCRCCFWEAKEGTMQMRLVLARICRKS
jgi:hypothetical protein